LLESAYLTCLTRDLANARVRIERQKAVPLIYKDVRIDCAYRADLVVEESVVVEVKAIEAFAPIHSQQLYTYLRLGSYPVGLLLNFNASTMKAGIKRIVNRFPDK
jgi:GxxExxY protein